MHKICVRPIVTSKSCDIQLATKFDRTAQNGQELL